MGLGTSKYEAELKEFELALGEWEEVCAAMAAEEAAAAYDASMGRCGLTLYCAQQCAGSQYWCVSTAGCSTNWKPQDHLSAASTSFKCTPSSGF